jgi:hypothetical protein
MLRQDCRYYCHEVVEYYDDPLFSGQSAAHLETHALKGLRCDAIIRIQLSKKTDNQQLIFMLAAFCINSISIDIYCRKR